MGRRVGEIARTMARKARGIVGLGLIGGVAGLLLGFVWGLVGSILRSGVFFDPAYLRFLWQMATGNALGFAMIGAFTTTGFGVLVAATDFGRSLDELPLWRMGLFGALTGAAFPPLVVVWQVGWSTYLGAAVSLLPVSVVLAAIGGGATASMVALAKRASARELTVGTSPDPRLPPPTR